jgi:CHAD domain-containing protein
MRTFSSVLVPETAAALAEELAWFAGELGHARDTEVLFARLRAAVDSLPEADRGAALAALEAWAADEQPAEPAASVLDDGRYAALVRELASVAVAPPFTGPADAVAVRALPSLVRPSVQAFRSRMAQAVADGSGPADYHRARIAGKRLRYAAEVTAPVYPKAAARYVDTLTSLQDELGIYHDLTVAIDALRARALEAPAADAFALGSLYAEQVHELGSHEAALRKSWAKRQDRVRLSGLTDGE